MSFSHLNNRIKAASNASECEGIKVEITTLLANISAKQKSFQQQDKEAGLNAKGRKVITCICGNSMKPEGAYVGSCKDCQEAFCVDCLVKCEECGKLVCNACEKKEPCAKMCDGCEDVLLCKDCLNVCTYCEDKKICGNCPKECGRHEMICPDCFDYMNGY